MLDSTMNRGIVKMVLVSVAKPLNVSLSLFSSLGLGYDHFIKLQRGDAAGRVGSESGAAIAAIAQSTCGGFLDADVVADGVWAR